MDDIKIGDWVCLTTDKSKKFCIHGVSESGDFFDAYSECGDRQLLRKQDIELTSAPNNYNPNDNKVFWL